MATLENVQQSILDQKLNWIADSNAIGRSYIRNGTLNRFGYAPKGRELGGYWKSEKPSTKQTLAFMSEPNPQVVDWGETDEGDDYLPPVRDQKNCGSCVAFATCSILESRMNIIKGSAEYYEHLSVAQLFFCSPGENKCMNGWNIGPALKYCRDNGIGLSLKFPYKISDKKCNSARKNITPVVKVKNWRRISDNAKRLEVIKDRGPVIGAMNIYSDFLWYSSGVYRPSNLEFLGRHAIAIIGYDLKMGAWIVMNSWGRNWGKGGFARIGFGSCGIDSEFDFYDINIKIL